MKVALLLLLLLIVFPRFVHASANGRAGQDGLMPALHRYDIALEYQFSEFVTGDFNGDRAIDLALIEPRLNRLVILYGSAVLDEFTPKFFALPAPVQDAQVADLNHDGISDLIFLTKSPERLLCYYGNASERLLLKAELDIDAGAEKLLVFSAHYRTSIFFYGQMRGIGYVEHFPAFGFVRKPTLAGESIFAAVALSEPSSRDALPNFVAYSAVERAVKHVRNDQDSLLGSFSLRLERSLSSFSVADFNQNGLPDIALGFEASRYAPAELRVIYDIGVQTGNPSISLSLDAAPARLSAQDLNNDGYADILALNPAAQQLSLFLGKSGGDFQERYALGIDNAAQFKLADLNGDKFPEIIFLQPAEKRVVIFSATSMRESKKTAALSERLVISPRPTSLVVMTRKPQTCIAALGQAQATLSLMSSGKPWQIHKPLSLGGKMKFVWQPDDGSDLFAISELSDRFSVFALKSLSTLEKLAELSILALNITGVEHWQLRPSSAFFFLLDRGNHEILPQLILYQQTRAGQPQLSEMTFAPFVPIENLLFLHRVRLHKQLLVAAIERDNAQTIKARLYAFGKQSSQHVQLVEKAQIRLLSGEMPVHACLCDDFDGDQKPDWILASSNQTWLFLSSNRYKEESLSKIIAFSPSDFARAMDINGDGHLDILIGKADKQQLCVAFGGEKGKFSTLKTIATDVLVADAKALKLDSETTLLVANAKLHTLDVIKIDALNASATARQ